MAPAPAALERPAFWADAAVKAALVALLIFPFAAPHLPQFEGKAMTGRAIAYPIAMLLVPVIWWAVGRARGWRYPYDVDILVVLPFAIDMAGNAANLYDTIDWWDDANHFVNWAILVAGVTLLLLRTNLPGLAVAGLGIGFGALSAIVWELLEYVTFIRHSSELETAYTDTLGDLLLGVSGSILAATALVVWCRRRPR
jgi:hypothetical protein